MLLESRLVEEAVVHLGCSRGSPLNPVEPQTATLVRCTSQSCVCVSIVDETRYLNTLTLALPLTLAVTLALALTPTLTATASLSLT